MARMKLAPLLNTAKKCFLAGRGGPAPPLPSVLTRACASADGVDGGGDGGGGVEGQMAVLARQVFVLPAGSADAYARVSRVLPSVEFIIGVLSLVIVVRLPVVHRVRPAPALAAEAPRRAVLQVVEPHGEGAPVLQRGGGVYQGVGQQLPALLDVLVVFNRVGQDFRQEFHVFDFCFNVSGLQ